MRVKVLFYLLPILALVQSASAVAQPKRDLLHYIHLYTLTDGQSAGSVDDITKFVGKLEDLRKSDRSDHQFLNRVFTKTHQRFLKHFEQYATFGETMSTGTYNCLTGTALYALLLSHFGYEY